MKKLCLFLLFASCAPQIETFGFENLEYESQFAVEKKDDKATILSKFGLPNALSMDKNTWYYVSFEKHIIAFIPPKIKEDLMMKLKFNDKGLLVQKTLVPHFLKKQKMLKDTTPIERSKKSDNYIADIFESVGNVAGEQEPK